MVARLRAHFTLTPLGDGGSVMAEFAMVFPVFFTLVLLLIQLVLLANARVIVSYAAFCAARSAVVTIPRYDLGSEGENIMSTEGYKIDDIQTAAAIACIPISPRIQTVTQDMAADLARLGFPQPVDNPYFGYELPTDSPFWNAIAQNPMFNDGPRVALQSGVFTGIRGVVAAASNAITGIGNLAGSQFPELTWILEKYPYSKFFTEVDINNGRTSFQPNGAVTVTVKYPFYLNVPFVRRLLGKKMGESFYQYFQRKRTGGFAQLVRVVTAQSQLYYVMIEETSTMMNEGEHDNLPR